MSSLPNDIRNCRRRILYLKKKQNPDKVKLLTLGAELSDLLERRDGAPPPGVLGTMLDEHTLEVQLGPPPPPEAHPVSGLPPLEEHK